MKERGQAFLVLLLILVIGGSWTLFTFYSPSSQQLNDDIRVAKVLATAKEALIGYAASSSVRPGQLPCPDVNNDGDAELPNASGCPSGNLGRLPWKTLGLEDVRDSAGERLWYAVSPNFTRDPSGCSPTPGAFNPCYLNSDTKGTLTISQDKAATVITNEAVAVIFAPGQVIAGQNRIAANENNPAHFLDTTDGVSNSAGPPFISALNSDRLLSSPAPSPFNDRLMVITTAHLMPVVEKRVGREVLKILKSYRDVVGVYPDADCSDGNSDVGENRSRIPWRTPALPVGGFTLPRNWGNTTPPAVPALPNWFINNYWSWVIYYSKGSPTVDGTPKDVVIIMTGPAGAGRPDLKFPSGTPYYCDEPQWALYIDDLENRDDNDTFITPISTANTRDRIYACPGESGIC